MLFEWCWNDMARGFAWSYSLGACVKLLPCCKRQRLFTVSFCFMQRYLSEHAGLRHSTCLEGSKCATNICPR